MQEVSIPQLAPHDLCTGCGACANACVKGAIHMLPDREGFLRPTVTDACIQCGHCSHVCPAGKQPGPRPEPAVFAVWNPEESVRMQSSAGGVFFPLAEHILESGGVVFGAVMDEKLHVSHIAVQSKADLPRLQGVKLVQSQIGDSYQKVRYYLDRGRRVLFVGTPCQVHGLYRYLGDHPEQLLTCDLLCQGAPSPGVWERTVQAMSYIKQKPAVSVEFFQRLAGERHPRFHMTFRDASPYDAPLSKSPYGRGLMRQLFLRPVCHRCPYTCTQRQGDLTLGVFRGLEKAFPELGNQSPSLLLVNSPKGAQIFDTLPLRRIPRTLAEAVAANPALSTPLPMPPQRQAFFEAYARQPFHQVYTRFFSSGRPKADKPARRSLLGKLLQRKEK